MKRMLAAACVLLLMLPLGGCFSAVQLSDRALVQAIGVDYENGRYKLTFQIYTAEGGGGQTAVDASSQNVIVLQSEGETIGDAVQNAALKQGKVMYFGHNQMILLGTDLLEQGITEMIAYFHNHSESRYNVQVAAVDGEAAEVLTVPLEEGILPADTISDMLQNHAESGKGIEMPFFELARDDLNTERSAILPLMKLEQEESESESSFSSEESGESSSEESLEPQGQLSVVGAAVIQNSTLAGTLDDSETQGLQILRDEVTKTTVTVEVDGVSRSFDLSKLCTKISVENAGNSLQYHITVSATAIAEDLLLTELEALSDDEFATMQSALEIEIYSLCEAAISRSITELQSDVLRLASLTWQRKNKAFLRLKENWSDELGNFTFEISVNANLKRHTVGTTNNTK